MTKAKNYVVILLLLILGCAYQGSPGGGPKDVKGPEFLKVAPLNETSLENLNKITISFNEDINPTSLINSIEINPEIDFSTEVKGKKIIIRPLQKWPKDIPIEINLNRKLSDFHNNMIDENIQLIYNIGFNKYCSIGGFLYNQRLNKQYTVFIYDDSENFIKKVNVNKDYGFNINYLQPGNYIIVASEGNIEPSINDSYYGVSTELVILDLNDCIIKDIGIYIDEPLQKLNIIRVETVNSRLLNIIYDDNTSSSYVIDPNLKDSMFINIVKSNRLFEYSAEPYLHFIEDVLDTIPPEVHSVESSDSLIAINFSEPIINSEILIFGQKNNDWVKLDYKNSSSMTIDIENKLFSKIKIFGNSVKDFNGNTMLDSIKVHEFSNTMVVNEGLSMLKGKINGYKDQNIVVEAKNISLNLIYRELLEDSIFTFNDLEPGKYVLRAYKSKNKLNPLIYYSGTINPYNSAAKFSIYKDTVEVRKFWDTQGINIDF